MPFISNLRAIGSLFALPWEYFIDFLLAFRYSKASPISPKDSRMFYDIILLAHTVEKGLSQPCPRPAFGRVKILQLLSLVSKADWTRCNFAIEKTYGALLEYISWNDLNGYDIREIRPNIDLFLSQCQSFGVNPQGGTKRVDLASSLNLDTPADLLIRRFSCRLYSPDLVDDQLVSDILRIAQRAPSQCNRQSARVHLYRGIDKTLPLLRLQRGAVGFDHTVQNLFVITSDMVAWSGSNARNQSFVDGSLFAMQLSLACSAYGLVSCPLNLAISNYREYRIKKLGQIPQSERLIMMLSFGYPLVDSEPIVAAFSSRVPTEMTLKIH